MCECVNSRNEKVTVSISNEDVGPLESGANIRGKSPEDFAADLISKEIRARRSNGPSAGGEKPSQLTRWIQLSSQNNVQGSGS